ncbi:MAG: tRNA (adenosine(37)-N6)-dimethylallyltransferase MiaA [Gammaproteobacteria bacterium]
MGPTASGKTDLALELVRRFPCDVISVDSAMVYRGMDIGTAKPGPEVLRAAPHRLIDVCDPSEPYSAARFRRDALREVELIRDVGRLPLLVGGTMLYFRALERGLSPLPSADAGVRRELEREARELGWQTLHARLAQVDPQAARRIHPNDPQRIQRALEVYRLTGMPMSAWFARLPAADRLPYRLVKLVLAPSDRDVLGARIADRFQVMLEQGFLDEVKTLWERPDLGPDQPSMRSVGYRQAWAYLDGRLTRDEMVERAIIATRQYAKRQLTWLRSEPQAERFDALSPRLLNNVLKWLDGISCLHQTDL